MKTQHVKIRVGGPHNIINTINLTMSLLVHCYISVNSLNLTLREAFCWYFTSIDIGSLCALETVTQSLNCSFNGNVKMRMHSQIGARCNETSILIFNLNFELHFTRLSWAAKRRMGNAEADASTPWSTALIYCIDQRWHHSWDISLKGWFLKDFAFLGHGYLFTNMTWYEGQILCLHVRGVLGSQTSHYAPENA